MTSEKLLLLLGITVVLLAKGNHTTASDVKMSKFLQTGHRNLNIQFTLDRKIGVSGSYLTVFFCIWWNYQFRNEVEYMSLKNKHICNHTYECVNLSSVFFHLSCDSSIWSMGFKYGFKYEAGVLGEGLLYLCTIVFFLLCCHHLLFKLQNASKRERDYCS